MTTLADRINNHLTDGGAVQITTYTKSIMYTTRHAGWFVDRKGSLFVQHGRGFDKLSFGNRLMVGLRFGKMKDSVV